MVDRSQKNLGRSSQYSNFPNEYTTKKPKDWKSLNMRVPGGISILELQNIQRKGYLVEPKIPDNYFDQYGLEDKFTEDEIKEFKEAFLFFDREGDGTMATEDLPLALRAVKLIVTGKEIRELQMKYDPDNSGSIDIKDFLSCIADVSNKADNPDIMQQCFSVFDKENTGVIKTDEFRHVLKAIGDCLSDEEVNSLLKDLDIYGDGHIRMKDLIKLLNLRM